MDQAQQGAILQLVAFAVAEQQYALPLPVVERVLPMVAVSPLPQAPPIALGVINVHGRVMPVLDLRRRFGLPSHIYGLTARLLVARTRRHTLALPVDAVHGVLEVATEMVMRPDVRRPRLGRVAGIVPLADGVLLLQDLEAFLSLHEERQLTEALKDMAQ
jgi:purine-binding chemotaxis protein CheW